MFSVNKIHINLVSLEFRIFLNWLFTSPLTGKLPDILHKSLSTEYSYTCTDPLPPSIIDLSPPLPLDVIILMWSLGCCRLCVEYGKNSCWATFEPLWFDDVKSSGHIFSPRWALRMFWFAFFFHWTTQTSTLITKFTPPTKITYRVPKVYPSPLTIFSPPFSFHHKRGSNDPFEVMRLHPIHYIIGILLSRIWKESRGVDVMGFRKSVCVGRA